MRIVITGGPEGQVLRSLAERGAAAGHDIVPLGRPQLELVGDEEAIVRAVERTSPEVIVSAAAFTAVDKAESEQDLAFAINTRGAGAVARAAERLGVPIVHLSTDYVFDGSKSAPYTEDDVPRPKSVYGASKLAGEKAVLEGSPGAVVVRTAWVYSPFDTNFVKTMLRLAADREEVGVVADQHGNPTSALEIAEGILAVAANLVSSQSGELRGVFHMTAGGEATWATFAECLLAVSAAVGGPTARVRPITTPEYPTSAARPANSCLDSSKLARIHGVRLPDWRCSIEKVVRRLVAERALEQGQSR